MANFTFTNKSILAILNSIKGKIENLDIIKNATSVDDILNADFMEGARCFDNAYDLSDSDMSKSSPEITINIKTITQPYGIFVDYNFNKPLDDFDYYERPSRYDCYTKVNNIATQNNVFKIFKEIGEVDRVGVYIDGSTMNNFNSTFRTYLEKGTNCFTVIPSIGGRFKVKSITNGIIEDNGICDISINDTVATSFTVNHMSYPSRSWEARNITSTLTEENIFLANVYKNHQVSPSYSIINVDDTYKSNVWIFNSESALDNFLTTGDYTEALNYNSESKPTEEDLTDEFTWYMNCDISRGSNLNNISSYESNYIRFTALNSISKRPIVGYIVENDNGYNVRLKIKNSNAITKVEESFNGGASYSEVSVSSFSNPKWGYNKTKPIKLGAYYYDYNNRTNIPIFGSEGDADRFLDNEIDYDSAINEPIGENPESNIGDKKDSSSLNELYLPIALSKTIVLNYSALSEVGRTLYDEQAIDEILDGLKLMGETPLNFICDLFALPFNPLPFTTNSVNNTMFYGLYSVTMANSFHEVIASDKILTMFSVPITGNFKDWRDYMQNYYLYLPYVGITALDIDKYMYKKMTCKVQCDVRTGSIKYYLFANNVMVDTFEGSVRVSMPIIGTNNFASTMSKIGAVSNVVESFANVGSVAPGKAEINTGAIASGITNIATLTAASPKHCSGNFSSQTAIMDELSAYLIIDAQEIIYSNDIVTAYNIPDNRYGKIGSCRGYMQAENIKLVTSATDSEHDEIMSLIRSGIII